MCKIKTSVVFKTYNQQQGLLLPPSLEELIGPNHLVRVVNELVEAMDMTELVNLYEGGGTSAYHPRMLLKVLLYGYSMKIYTGRKLAQALNQDIHFMWLSAMSRPDFRTINNFRSCKAKEVIEDLFKEMLDFLLEHNYIKLENYFCDGSTFRADGNKNQMIWKKNSLRYKVLAEEQCKELFKQIDELNNSDDKQYSDNDLEQNGTSTSISREDINRQVALLNETIKTATDKKKVREAKSLKKQLDATRDKITRYDQQLEISGARSGYNKTDNDATAMMMKNKVEVLPAYNVLAGCESQFITGVSVHQNTNDGTCLPEHIEQIKAQQPLKPKQIIADSIFGTEQNYELIEKEEMKNYMKFPTFHKEQKKSYDQKIFLKENFRYDALTDTYGCPNEQLLILKRSYEQVNNRTGYRSALKEYECSDCKGCPFYEKCCKSPNGENRTITVNENLENYKQQARENLNSAAGIELRKQRSIEIESCFGDIKHNMNFRRFHLRGLSKVKTEFTLVAMAHNLRKIQIQRQQKAA